MIRPLPLLPAALLLLPACTPGECPTVQARPTAPKPAALDELSGLAASLRHPGVVYGHNDSGDTARLIAFEPGGGVRATFLLEDVNAVDWEDMAVAEVQGTSWIHVADTGDNQLERAEVVIHRVAEPALPPSNREVILGGVESYRVTYPSGSEDAEGLAVEPGTGALILVTRDRNDSDETRLYRVPLGQPGGTTVAILVGRIADPSGGFRTKAADWRPDGWLALLRHSSNTGATELLTWSASPDVPLATILAPGPCVAPLDPFEQAEALCFLGDGTTVLVGGEGDADPLRPYLLVGPPSNGWRVW